MMPDPHLVAGGFKASGCRKDLSVFALEGFSRIKNVMARID
jgi:acyl-CoA reductase-like NAD-dependent aldehyde dehydrogenase